MTITPHFIIIAEQAFLTAGSNNLNLIGIFSQINASKLPHTHSHFALVVNFEAPQAGQLVLHTDIMDPSSKQVAHTELPVTVTKGNMQVIAHFENMQFAMTGPYEVNVSVDGQSLGQRTLTIAPVVRPTPQKTTIA